MQTIKMKGTGAIVITIDKLEFRPKNGILEIPAHLERHATAQGFRRMSAAELNELQLEPDPATETLALPADHPQAEANAKRDEKVDAAIAAGADA